MSIEQLVKTHEDGGELHRIYPRRFKAGGRPRELYVGTTIERQLDPRTRGARQVRELWAKVGADLFIFANGAELAVRREGATQDGDEQSNLARLEPRPEEEVWELRTQLEMVGVRIFGRFFLKNHFVGLTWHYKVDLLGPQAYDLARLECQIEWDRLFYGERFLRGVHPDDYVSRTRLVPRR
jgi:hypothetical protein